MLNNSAKFILEIHKQEIELLKTTNETDTSGNKKQQTREATFFRFLGFAKNNKYNILIDDIFECLAFIEILKGYNYNKLNKDVDYSFNSFQAKAVKRKNINKLKIIFHKTDSAIYITKVNCVILSAQLNKIIYKCELSSPNNQFILNCPSEIE